MGEDPSQVESSAGLGKSQKRHANLKYLFRITDLAAISLRLKFHLAMALEKGCDPDLICDVFISGTQIFDFRF